MKVLALIGSLRKESQHRKLYEAYRKIAGDRATFTEGRIDNLPLYNEDLKASGQPPEVLALAKQIKDADAVLFVSPEYNYSVPAPLKNAIDWVSKVPDQPFAGKPAAILSGSIGKLGGSRMQYHLRQIGVFIDLRFMNKPEVIISEIHKHFDEAGNLVDETTRSHLEKHFEAFSKFR